MEKTLIILTVFGFSFVCVTSAPIKQQRDVDIYSFHINSTVNSRYAINVITSRVANRLNESKEIHFEVKIPKNAFISKFKMVIEGKTYDGIVKKKEEAEKQYSQAVSRGESAGIVSSVGRTLEEFKTSVTVAAFSKVTFELTYEELLKRRLGKYELRIHAQPMQPVADFKIDVYMNEPSGFSFLEIKGGLKSKELSSAVISTLAESAKEAWVNFYPTREQQTKCESCGDNGLNGDLLIEYDVKRQNQNGELQASNGYFVHYFAPTNIQQIPKNVVFIIDRSGSMHGRKMDQTRTAMLKILGDLAPEDYFGLIIFDSEVNVWKKELLQATERNINQAKDYVKTINDRGATDINAAVLKAVDMITKHRTSETSASLLILLTDGDPTSGETNTGRIQNNVREAIGGKFPLYCLGFGFDVNFDFLEKMALENNGVARRIYEDSDADLQLQGFYEEVATPLLSNVQLNYIGAANLTQTTFKQFYNGSEIVVAGQITDNNLETLQTEVIAISKDTNVTYQDSVSIKDVIDVLPQHENFIQRLWAYLTVKQLLEKEMTLKGDEKEAAKKNALDLSLKYEFVTPLTSMVVTKPQEEEIHVAHKPKEGKKPHTDYSVGALMPNLGQSFIYHSSMGRGVLGEPGPPGLPGRDLSFEYYEDPLPVGPKPLPTLVHIRQSRPVTASATTEFSMNGQLSRNGFQRIVLHYKTAKLLVNHKESVYSDGGNSVRFVWGQSEPSSHQSDSISIFKRSNELDVTVGDVRVVLHLHKKDGNFLLWPVVHQLPKSANIQGILGKADLEYEELPGSKIKIKDLEVEASQSSAIDFRFPAAPSVDCWLVPLQSALQGELADFTVSKL
ncbi:inter-alpha-trypsin inhibitor heavy chain H4 isoform X9 [Silurus asotus]|uniref:Inter-alpha-trypsin inhibitor heavy chain H4 isoform X9 n=1 Tax=Silurus asotus TaxID=30991 RepID=A0AAD4ZZL2_SILAS|nr:inter-alpha-trypsin inhibitor heavy chain H4 isoform X9 [Silurus asotus]